ncbi:TerD family protein (plasmid) [Alkaliphilus sp. B6464]|nr:TerD family protein [Alkaliphilus sp. B6464]
MQTHVVPQENLGGPLNFGAGISLAKGGGVSLSKNSGISLSKVDPSLKNVMVGAGWDVNTMGSAYDLDIQAWMLGQDGRVLSDAHFVFYNQSVSPDGSVRHSGDNRNGQGEGDDETMDITLDLVSPQINEILFTITIDNARAKGQSFGNVQNAFIRLVNKDTGNQIARYDLSGNYAGATSLIFAKLVRDNTCWNFIALGDGTQEELVNLCQRYGVNVG